MGEFVTEFLAEHPGLSVQAEGALCLRACIYGDRRKSPGIAAAVDATLPTDDEPYIGLLGDAVMWRQCGQVGCGYSAKLIVTSRETLKDITDARGYFDANCVDDEPPSVG